MHQTALIESGKLGNESSSPASHEMHPTKTNMQNPVNKYFPLQTYFETCGGMHLIAKPMGISFRSTSKKRSIR